MIRQPSFIARSPNPALPSPQDESTLDIPDFVSSHPAADHASTARADSRSSGKSDASSGAANEAEENAIEIESGRVRIKKQIHTETFLDTGAARSRAFYRNVDWNNQPGNPRQH